jgi:hypothetical protein
MAHCHSCGWDQAISIKVKAKIAEWERDFIGGSPSQQISQKADTIDDVGF